MALRWLDQTPTSRVIARCTQDVRAGNYVQCLIVSPTNIQSSGWTHRSRLQLFGRFIPDDACEGQSPLQVVFYTFSLTIWIGYTARGNRMVHAVSVLIPLDILCSLIVH